MIDPLVHNDDVKWMLLVLLGMTVVGVYLRQCRLGSLATTELGRRR